ncbi:MAG: 2-C-methyl-D-erythritol 2,4-cyclodiphosphate synthase [Terriglobia bacterium]
MSTRFGFGYDIHRFAPHRKLILGGVHLPYDRGLDGHSDADVLLHAICDALLGAAALGDIGTHFPNTDPRFHNISSLKLLSLVKQLLDQNHLQIIHIDATVVLEAPKLAPYISKMRQNIAESLDSLISQISVKATTNEGLGAIGQGDGCAAFAVASLHLSSAQPSQ